MNILFLRGQVPIDRDPKQIMFDKIEDCDDMWTQLAYSLCKNHTGEIWYWGGNRKQRYNTNFTERWMKRFDVKAYDFNPDVIFARGGFEEYDKVLKRNPQAYKIYYGAGKRFLPKYKFKEYDLILVDTPLQLAKAKMELPGIRSELLIKPAAENVFTEDPGAVNSNKPYDVIMVANEHPKGIKGQHFALSSIPKDMSILQVGIASKKLQAKYKHVKFTNWVPRKNIPSLYAKSKVSIVCCEEIDSCPRIIPESLSCGCPLVILDRVNFWKEKYINEKTGIITNENNFVNDLKNAVNNYRLYKPKEYYDNNLSLDKSSERIWNFILETC